MSGVSRYFTGVVRAPDPDKPETLLWAAAWEGEAEKIPGILKQGADINALCTAGWSALHRAVVQRNQKTVQVLLDCGADPCVSDVKQQTPLHFAAARGHRDISELLLLYGANPAVKDEYGKTPSALSRERGRDQLASLIEGYVSLRHSRRLKAVRAGRVKPR